jgi:hypothetical protein
LKRKIQKQKKEKSFYHRFFLKIKVVKIGKNEIIKK